MAEAFEMEVKRSWRSPSISLFSLFSAAGVDQH